MGRVAGAGEKKGLGRTVTVQEEWIGNLRIEISKGANKEGWMATMKGS